jgi:hypothetical protein
MFQVCLFFQIGLFLKLDYVNVTVSSAIGRNNQIKENGTLFWPNVKKKYVYYCIQNGVVYGYLLKHSWFNRSLRKFLSIFQLLCHLHQKTSNINIQTLLFNICCRYSCIRYLELPINTKFHLNI